MTHSYFILFETETGVVFFLSEQLPDNDFQNECRVSTDGKTPVKGINWNTASWDMIECVEAIELEPFKYVYDPVEETIEEISGA